MTRHKLTAADFFIIRVPRQSTKIVQDLPTSRAALDDLLDSWLTQASTQEALYLASPALLERATQAKAAGKRELSLSLALLKYLVRSSTRPTPFGLFAGICMGTFAELNSLQPGEPSMDVRCTRLDMALLEQIRQTLVAAAGIDSAIRYQLNPTLLQLGNTYHYIETYLSGNSRQYRLSKLDVDPALQLLLSKFTAPQTLAELVTVFQQLQPTPEPEEIHDYLLQLKQAGVLQAELKLPLTSGSPDAGFLRSLYAQQQDGIAEDLQRVLTELKQLDDKKQTTVKQYQQLQHQLQQLTATSDAGQVFQLDLWRNFQQAELSRDIANDVSEVMLCLQALMPVVDPVLSEFKQKFNQRFEGQLVPLLLLLDEEAGIPYSTDAGYATPLLAGIAINSRRKVSAGNVFHPLEHKLSQLLTENATQTIKLESSELLKPFQRDALLKKFPGSCAATISVYHDEQQQPLLHWQGCFGPSAANIIGRFCHLSTDLAASVQKHLRQEEALASQAIFAEVLHMPDGRPGNVIARPRLRQYEIVFLADTETETDAQIPVSDLYVYMEAGELKLYSGRLQRQILPRLSSAHNYSGRSLGIYRFLATMQHQETQLPNFKLPTLFQQLRRIPRIQIDRIIVQPAQWRLDRDELQSLLQDGNFNPAAWEVLQNALQLERYVCYAVGDNVLTIDLNNPWSISMLLAETVDLPRVVVKEALLFKYQSGVKSAAGHFAHEIVIPFLNPLAASASALPQNFERRLGTDGQQRHFAPGSEWLSLKIFAAQTSAELLLQDKLTSFIRQAMAEQWCQQWFFIRYNDPDWHLRLRFHGEPALLYGKLLPALAALCQPELQSRQVHKIELFTYEREFDRYGGETAMSLIERWFAVDSDCTLTLLSWSEHDSEQVRLRWMVQLINTVLEAFGLSKNEQLAVISRLRANFGTEFREHHELRRQLGRKYRQFQSQLEQDLAQGWADEPAHDNNRLAGLVLNYANAIRPLAREISNLVERGLLSCSIELLLGSLLHMSHNRIFKAYGREQEFVVYDFVRRLYLARQARSG